MSASDHPDAYYADMLAALRTLGIVCEIKERIIQPEVPERDDEWLYHCDIYVRHYPGQHTSSLGEFDYVSMASAKTKLYKRVCLQDQYFPESSLGLAEKVVNGAITDVVFSDNISDGQFTLIYTHQGRRVSQKSDTQWLLYGLCLWQIEESEKEIDQPC